MATAKKSTAPVERVMYSREETAAMFGVGVRLVKRWTLDGKLKPIRPSGPKGPVFYSADEIKRAMRAWQS